MHRLFLPAGVIEVLADALCDKNEKVRRRVMATLGELLFYVATQQQVWPFHYSSTFPDIMTATLCTSGIALRMQGGY